MNRIKYGEWDCMPMLRRYENGNTKIVLLEYGTRRSVMTVTINIVGGVPEGYAYIKNYNENQGILDVLVVAGIITHIVGYVRSNNIVVPLAMIDLSKLEKDEFSNR